MAIIQSYPVSHVDEKLSEELGRGLVVGDHFSIGQTQNDQGQIINHQIYGLLVIWENQRTPAQMFHEPQELQCDMDFDSYFEDEEEEE